MEQYFDLIAHRESCRDYAKKPVEREKLIRCLEAARLAPSACNAQPWSCIAITEEALTASVVPLTQDMGMNKFTSNCPCFVVMIEEKPNLSARFGNKFKHQDYSSIDIGIATSQFCLAATAQGLSTCILGWFNEPKLKELLSVPNEKRVRLVVCMGYAKTDAIREKKRKSLEELAQIR